MVIKGDLLSVDLSNVFQMLAMNRKRGVLHIHNRENVHEKRALFLDADRVGLVGIPDSQDLAAILVDQSVLDYDAWRDAHQKGLQFGVAPSDYILKRGTVSNEQIAAAEARLQEELVLEIFLWKNVAFSLDEDAIPADNDKRQMFVLDLMVMEAARRQDEWTRVIELLGGGRNIWRYREDADYSAAQLTSVDRIVLDHLDGVHGTREIMKSTGLPRYQVDSSIGSLVEQDLVEQMGLNDLLDVGDQLAEGGYHGEAIRLYQCAIRHDRKSIALHKRLASCYLKNGRVAKAAAHYKFCAMMLLENNLAPEALAIYQYVATVLPTDFRTIEVALGLIARLGGPTTNDDQRTIDLAAKLCQFYHDCRLLDRAEEVLKHLLDVDPSNNSYGFMLARLQTKTGRISDAVATYMKLAGRLSTQGDLEGALNVYKMVCSFETPNRDHCARKIAGIRETMERRHRRRAMGFGFVIVAIIGVLAVGGYWFFQRAGDSRFSALQETWDETRDESEWMRLSREFEDLASSFPLTPTADRAREFAARAQSKAEVLRSAEKKVVEAERNRRLALLHEAGLAYRQGLESQDRLDLHEALESFKKAMSFVEEGSHQDWSEHRERRIVDRISELETHLGKEAATLVKIRELREAGQDAEAFWTARGMLDPTDGGIDATRMKVISNRTLSALTFSFRVDATPADSTVVLDGESITVPRQVELGGDHPSARVEVSRTGYRSSTLDLSWNRGSYRQILVLERLPLRHHNTHDRITAIDSDGRDMVAVCSNGVTIFFKGGPEGAISRDNPDALLSITAGPLFENRRVIFGTADGRIRILDRDRRALVWSERPGFGTISQLAVAGRHLLAFGGGRGLSAHVYDLETGRGAGSIDLPSRVVSAVGFGSQVVCVTEAGQAILIDPATVSVKAQVPGPYRAMIAVADGAAYLASQDGRTVSALQSTGQLKTTSLSGLDQPIGIGPFTASGKVACTLINGSLAVLSQGQLVIHEDTESEIMSKLLARVFNIGGGEVMIPTDDGRLLRIDLVRGQIKCAYRPEVSAPASATRHGSLIVLGAGDADGRIEIYED